MKAMYCEQLGELILDNRTVAVPAPIHEADMSIEEKTNLVRVWAQASGRMPFGVEVVALENQPATEAVA